MVTTEQIFFSPEGRMISSGPLNYKIPGVRNIPREFRVKLLKDSEGEKEVYSSKVNSYIKAFTYIAFLCCFCFVFV